MTRPKILILDDSTSSVDVETETKIQDALDAQHDRHTSLVVAQRISTVLKADKIIVIDEGRIAAEGTHRELMQSSPIYQEIYDSQLGNGFKLEEAADRSAWRWPHEQPALQRPIPAASAPAWPRRPAGVGKIEKARDPRNALIRLLPYLKPFNVMLMIVFVCVVIYTLLGLVGPYLMGVAIDRFIIAETAGRAGADRAVDAGRRMCSTICFKRSPAG